MGSSGVHSSVANTFRISECVYCVLPSRKDGVVSESYLTKVSVPSNENLKVSADVSNT